MLKSLSFSLRFRNTKIKNGFLTGKYKTRSNTGRIVGEKPGSKSRKTQRWVNSSINRGTGSGV